jgi:hypothetical protein
MGSHIIHHDSSGAPRRQPDGTGRAAARMSLARPRQIGGGSLFSAQ